MAESSSGEAIRALATSFDKHEALDRDRFQEVREDMKEQKEELKIELRDQRKDIGRLRDRVFIMWGAAIILIPAITELVHVFLDPK